MGRQWAIVERVKAKLADRDSRKTGRNCMIDSFDRRKYSRTMTHNAFIKTNEYSYIAYASVKLRFSQTEKAGPGNSPGFGIASSQPPG
jgi:hypothetical protein